MENNFLFDLQRFDGEDSADSPSANNIVGTTWTYNSKSNNWLNTHRAVNTRDLYDESAEEHFPANKLAITTTNVSIYSNGMRIGFVQSFTPSENRDITPIQELGTEGVVQMVPGNTRGGTIQLQRVALYNSDIWNALGLTPTGQFVARDDMITNTAFTLDDDYGTYGNPFRTLKDQRVPLEIWVETVLPNPDKMLRELYYDCWVSNYQKTIQAAQVWVSESVSLEYSDVYSEIITRTEKRKDDTNTKTKTTTT